MTQRLELLNVGREHVVVTVTKWEVGNLCLDVREFLVCEFALLKLLLDAEHAFIKIAFVFLFVCVAFLKLLWITKTLSKAVGDEIDSLFKILPF